jgi:2-aminoadipate transaminase
MLEALKTHMPDLPGLRWTKPAGGLFLWVELPTHMNADEIVYRAIDDGVAYVIGSAFYPQGGGQHTMRLNFSYPTIEQIHEGVRRLAAVIRKEYRPA